MKTIDYLSSLLPNFSKDRVLEDCRITHGEIKEFVIPAYDQAIHFFKGRKIQSEDLKGLFDTFRRLVKSEGNDDPISTIQKGMKALLINLEEIEENIEAVYSEEVAGGGMTYLKANLLQLAEWINFVSRYSLRFLDYAYICETAQYEEGGTSIAESLTPDQVQWVTANIIHFCKAFSTVTTHAPNMKRAISEMPDIIVTAENANTLQSTMGNKINPFNMELVPLWLNPIYHVGMMVAEWQANRHKEAKAQLTLLQLRKLNLEKLSQGKPDAATQRSIKGLEKRIDDLRHDLAKQEGKYKHG